MPAEPPRVLYLGPEGTFTHQAALDLAPRGASLEPVKDAQIVIAEVDRGRADAGIVAFENSLDGTVTRNIDALMHEASNCVIAGERVLPVSFDLYRLSDDETPLRRLIGHPVALGQVNGLIQELRLDVESAASNVAALADLKQANEPGTGATGPPNQAARFGLRVERQAVEDAPAATRFLLLQRTCPPPTGRDLTAFVVHPAQQKAGSLVSVLQQFSTRSINLTAIKSRPARRELGDYLFYLECEGHVADSRIRDAVFALIENDVTLRFLGSFPTDPTRPFTPAAAGDADADALYTHMLDRVRAP